MNSSFDYPSQVRESLSQLAKALDELLGSRYSLAVYGGTYTERIQGEPQPVKLALVVEKLSEEVLRPLREPIALAMRRCHLDVFLIEHEQLPRIADSFAVKLLAIQRHHEMLRGADPFADLPINPELVRLRLEQESRNHLMRLRRTFLLMGDSPESLALAIRKSVNSLLTECEAILSFLAVAIPDELDAFVATVASCLGLRDDVLGRVVTFRTGDTLGQVQSAYFELLSLVEQAALFVDQLDAKAS